MLPGRNKILLLNKLLINNFEDEKNYNELKRNLYIKVLIILKLYY